MPTRPLRLLLAAVLILAAGCSPPVPSGGPEPARPADATTPERAGFPMTVRDSTGRSVTLAAEPQRIISLAAGYTELLYALGLGDRIIAADNYSDYPPEVKAKAKLVCWPRPPLEQIVALKPDLILSLSQEEDFLQQADRLRIPALKLLPRSYAEAAEGMELIGRLVGRRERAAELAAGLRDRADAVRDTLGDAPPVRVMLELDATDPSRPYVAGSTGFYGQILEHAGGENVFADLSSDAAQVSTEQIVARNPDVILLGDAQNPLHPQRTEMLKERPGWKNVAAVRSGRVYAINSELVVRPGPRLAEGLEAIARALHPSRF